MTLINAKIATDVYLQNNFLSIGLNDGGTLGSRTVAPTAHDSGHGFTRVGLYADLDGFGVGKAGLQDIVLPGTIVEGFNIGYDIGSSNYIRTNLVMAGRTQIAGDSSTSAASNAVKAEWMGTTAEKLNVDQVITLSENAKYFRVDITLTNQSSSTMTDLRYMRTMDPDHTSNFQTKNVIVDQGTGKALVAAYASGNTSPVFYYADDPRAVVSTYGFTNTDPYNPQAYDTPQAEGYTLSGDKPINITFDVGTLAAGKSTTITFYIGATDNLDATIKAIDTNETSSIPVPPANTAPDAVADVLKLAYDKVGTGNVLANDKDAQKDALTASLVTGPKSGTLVLKADGSYTYTPNAGFSGTDSFTYAASDGKLSDNAVVTITVDPKPNTAPTAVADSLKVAFGTKGAGNVLTNDSDADKDALTASLVTGPKSGTLVLKADGSYSYTPNAGFSGTDTFTYAASDGVATKNAVVTITVDAKPNTAPVAAADALKVSYNTAGTGNVLTNDSDADNDALTASLVTGPKSGTLVLKADGSYSYTPNSGFSGTDSFTYAASDGTATKNAVVTITVDAKPNTAPTAVGDTLKLAYDSVGIGNVLTNDSDADDDALTASLVTGPKSGTLVLKADGSYSYTPNAGFSGTDSFTYAASDGAATKNAVVTLTVEPKTNTAPVAGADTMKTAYNTVGTGNVLINDTDGQDDVLTASLVTGPKSGTLVLKADGSYSYTPNAGFSGIDTFTYAASDGKMTDKAVVTIVVAARPNTAPVAVADSLKLAFNTAGTGNVLANDTDAQGDTLSASLVTGPKSGTLALKADGSYTYTPNAGFSGTDTFTYAASDGSLSKNAVVTITVDPIPNTAPVAVADSLKLAYNSAGTGNVLTNDRDAQGDTLNAYLVTGPKSGTLSLKADGSYTYTPNAGFSGTDSFTYAASDGKLSSNAVATITVDARANTAPAAVADTLKVDYNKAATGNVLANDTDAQGDTLSAYLVTGPKSGTLSLKADGSYTYTPNAGFSGTDSFTYAASDGKLSSNAVATLTVEAKPAPTTPDVAVLKGAGTLDASDTGNQVLTGASYHNAFYIGSATTVTGNDRITNFQKEDILVTNRLLYDNNRDGIIQFSNGNTLNIDAPALKGDTVHMAGVNALRLMGSSEGVFVYADASVRPLKAIESMIGNDQLVGDRADTASQTFFFDTALDLNLGNDTIVKFGAKDILVSTTALNNASRGDVINWDHGGSLGLAGGNGAPGDTSTAGEAGMVKMTDLWGQEINSLEFDGQLVHNGKAYFVYSLVGSAAGTSSLAFA